MPRKTSADADIFSITGSEPKPKKLPTLNQWLKENPDVSVDSVYSITKIWFPGTWDNYSIETTEFRASISPANPIYSALDAFAGKLEGRDKGLLLGIVDASQRTIRFVDCETYGKWKRLGNSGFAFEPVDG